MRKVVLLGLVVSFLIPINAQEFGYGGGMIYNVATPGANMIGIDARMSIPMDYYGIDVLEGIWVVPQISFYPIGERMDLNLGTSVHLGAYRLNKHLFYGLTNVSYSMWLDHNSSSDTTAGFSNFYWDMGAGWTTSKCFRPFAEFRLNFIRLEPSLRVGLIYTFNCKDYGQVPCSKPPKDPFPAPKK